MYNKIDRSMWELEVYGQELDASSEVVNERCEAIQRSQSATVQMFGVCSQAQCMMRLTLWKGEQSVMAFHWIITVRYPHMFRFEQNNDRAV